MNNLYKYGILIILVSLILIISNFDRGTAFNIMLTSLLLVLIIILFDSFVNFQPVEGMENIGGRANNMLQQDDNPIFISGIDTTPIVPLDEATMDIFNKKTNKVNILLNEYNCYDFKPDDDGDINYNILLRTSDTGDDISDIRTIFRQ